MTARVAVLDPEPPSRRVVVDALARWGYQAVEVTAGTDPLRTLLAEPPGAVILDLCHDGGRGLGTLRRLRRHPRLAAIPVVVATSRREPDVRAAATAMGASDVLRKPVRLGELRAALQRVLPRPAAPAPVGGRALAHAGPLTTELRLASIMVACLEARFTGTVILGRGQATRRIEILSGVPERVDAAGRGDALGEFLVARGAMDRAALSAARAGGAAFTVRDAARAIEDGRLRRLLEEHLVAELAAPFGWRDGRYELASQAPREPFLKEDAALRIAVTGARRAAALDDPTGRWLALASDHVTPTPRLEELGARLRTAGISDALLRSLSGGGRGAAVGDLYRSLGPADPGLFEQLTVLLELGLIHVGSLAPAPWRLGSTTDASIPDALMERVDAILERDVHGDDPYALLGLPGDISPAAVPLHLEAFERQQGVAEVLARLPPSATRTQVASVVTRMREAGDVLGDAERRRRHDERRRRLDDGIVARTDAGEMRMAAPDPAAQGLRAELLFGQAEEAMRRGSFKAASEVLARAVELAPDEPEVRALLGWVLHCYGDDDAAEASLRRAAAPGTGLPVGAFLLAHFLVRTERRAEGARLLEQLVTGPDADALQAICGPTLRAAPAAPEPRARKRFRLW